MAETAVGLFESKSAADAVIAALDARGIPPEGLRLIVEPEWLPVVSAASAPHTEFEGVLLRDLLAMGISEDQAESYMVALRHGYVLVLATGTNAQANDALAIMNAGDAFDVEEFEEREAVLTGVESNNPTNYLMHTEGSNDAGTHDTVAHTAGARVGQERKRAEGARVFSW
jgi:hypothetical protein